MTAAHAAEFVASLDGRLTNRGVNMALQSGRNLGDFLVQRGLWPENWFRGAGIGKRREVKDRRPQGLKPADLEKLLAAPDRDKANGLRGYLCLYVLSFVGLRCGELCALKLSDLHRDSCRLHIAGETAKTRTERWPFLPHTKRGDKRILKPEFSQPLDKWLLIRQSLKLPDEAPLFCTVSTHPGHREQGQPLTVQQVRQCCYRAGKKAGLGPIHPHQLRHCAGYLMAKAGHSIDTIREQLGHVSIAMSLHYSKQDAESIGDAIAERDASNGVKLPTRSRPRVMTPEQAEKLVQLQKLAAELGMSLEEEK
jgi:integrase